MASEPGLVCVHVVAVWHSIAFMSGSVCDRAAEDSVCMGSAYLVPVMLLQGESTPFELLFLEGQSELVIGNHTACQGQSSAEPSWVAVMFAIAGSEYSWCSMHLCTEVPVVHDHNWLLV